MRVRISTVFLIFSRSLTGSSSDFDLQDLVDRKFRALDAAAFDGDAILKEVQATSKELEEAELAVSAALQELTDIDSDISRLGFDLKKTQHIKGDLEVQTATLDKDLQTVYSYLDKVVQNLEGLHADHQSIHDSAVATRNEAEACQEWSTSLVTANVALENRLGEINRSVAELSRDCNESRKELFACTVANANKDGRISALEERVRHAEEMWDAERASFVAKITSLDAQVRRLSTESSSKDTRISVLQKTLVQRTVATKKSEAEALVHAKENEALREQVSVLEGDSERLRVSESEHIQRLSEMSARIQSFEEGTALAMERNKELQTIVDSKSSKVSELTAAAFRYESEERLRSDEISSLKVNAQLADEKVRLIAAQRDELLAERNHLQESLSMSAAIERELQNTIDSLRSAALENEGDKLRFWQILEGLSPGEVLRNGFMRLAGRRSDNDDDGIATPEENGPANPLRAP